MQPAYRESWVVVGLYGNTQENEKTDMGKKAQPRCLEYFRLLDTEQQHKTWVQDTDP